MAIGPWPARRGKPVQTRASLTENGQSDYSIQDQKDEGLRRIQSANSAGQMMRKAGIDGGSFTEPKPWWRD